MSNIYNYNSASPRHKIRALEILALNLSWPFNIVLTAHATLKLIVVNIKWRKYYIFIDLVK